MPGCWVDPPDGEMESEDAKERHDTEEEDEDMADEDTSSRSETFRMFTFYLFTVCWRKYLPDVSCVLPLIISVSLSIYLVFNRVCLINDVSH